MEAVLPEAVAAWRNAVAKAKKYNTRTWSNAVVQRAQEIDSERAGRQEQRKRRQGQAKSVTARKRHPESRL